MTAHGALFDGVLQNSTQITVLDHRTREHPGKANEN